MYIMSNDDVTTPSQDFDGTTRYFGRVKWFNNKAGYGFCTVVGETGGARVGEDVFVHHTGMKVSTEQYKYLVQGEYVWFNLRSSDSASHPYQAANLTGLWNGPLMCETRNEQRQQRGDDADGNVAQNTEGGRRRPRRNVRPKGSGPRDRGPDQGQGSGESWTMRQNPDVAS